MEDNIMKVTATKKIGYWKFIKQSFYQLLQSHVKISDHNEIRSIHSIIKPESLNAVDDKIYYGIYDIDDIFSRSEKSLVGYIEILNPVIKLICARVLFQNSIRICQFIKNVESDVLHRMSDYSDFIYDEYLRLERFPTFMRRYVQYEQREYGNPLRTGKLRDCPVNTPFLWIGEVDMAIPKWIKSLVFSRTEFVDITFEW